MWKHIRAVIILLISDMATIHWGIARMYIIEVGRVLASAEGASRCMKFWGWVQDPPV